MRFTIFVAAIASLCLNLPACAQDQPTATQSLNATFREVYAQARQHYKDDTSPVIISMGGKLIFYRNNTRVEEVSIIPPEWHTLKTVDHVPLALFVLLENKTDKPLDDATIQTLRTIDTKVRAAQGEIEHTNFSATTAARQKEILSRCLDFIASAVAKKTVLPSDFDSFSSTMGPLTLGNAYDAEVLELDALDTAVHRWEKSVSPEEWSQLHVVVCDSHMPRAQERDMQYFMDMLHQKQEGKRIVFMENNNDEQKALDLLATHILDARVAKGFFHDESRMHRDLLSDGARHYLKQHHPAP